MSSSCSRPIDRSTLYPVTGATTVLQTSPYALLTRKSQSASTKRLAASALGRLNPISAPFPAKSPDMGATISPFAAFQILQGLETLSVCMEQHNANAIVVANYLAGHSKVEKVYFPGLQTGEHRRRIDACLLGGYGALVGFKLKDGAEAGKRFIDARKTNSRQV